MTLQEIADYAMDYLDSKGIAADYEINDSYTEVFNPFTGETQRIKYKIVAIHLLDSDFELNSLYSKRGIRSVIDANLNNSK